MRRAISKMVACACATALAIGLLVSPVSAHVSIDSYRPVEQGSFATLGFNVPNERDDSATVALKIQIPVDHPLAFVSAQAKPGWQITTTMRTLETPLAAEGATIDEVVDTITWTATGETQIAPGQFDQFWISAGLMPTDVDSIGFPSIQTYASGEEVVWIDPIVEGEEEPEHPVPTVNLVAGSAADDDSDGTTLAAVALIVAVLALAAGGAAISIGRRRGVGAA